VFDKGQQLQLSRPPASDLSRSLVELSRKYGLHVELETEGEAVVGTPEKCDDTSAKCTKSNILSAVCGQAQRLWHQRQLVFKGGDSSGRVDVDKDIVEGDVESGRVEAVHVGKAPPTQKSPSSVMTVNETGAAERPPRNLGGSLRYRTLEYGASPADAEAQSSPDSGVQCCTVNPSEPVLGKVDKDPVAAVSVTIDRDVVVAATDKDVVAVASVKDVVVMEDKGEAVKADKDEAIAVPDKNAAAVLNTVDDGKKSVVMAKPKNEEPKHANPPPPPPPRKYSAAVVPPTVPATAVVPSNVPATTVVPSNVPATTVVPPTVPATVVVPPTVPATVVMPPTVPATVVVPPTVPATAVTVPQATGAVATCNASVTRVHNATVPPELCMAPVSVACAELTKTPAAEINEIRVDDDYYWCTTTAMAPPMSTFGKRPSVTPSVESSSGGVVADTTIGDRAAAIQGVYDKGAAVAPLMVDDSRDVVAGGTTSIEDASLPSFSSDEEEDDEDNCSNGVVLAADKTKFPLCSSIGTSADGVGGVSGGGSDAIKINCNGESPKNNNNNDDDEVDGSGVAPPVSAEPKSPTKLPSLRLSLSSPLSSTANTSCYSSSASSTSSNSPSPTNSTINNSPIVSKIPVRRQSAGSGVLAVSTPLTNGTTKKSIPLPLSRSGSRLAMWTSAN